MANYSLVINSRFKPFSFERYMQPLQLYTQAYRELENAYNALGVQAGTVESMLNKELDKDAYNQYQGYMQGLKESADILATQGLNPTLRGSLNNLYTRYSQEIVPIQKAAERRERLLETQQKLGPNYQFEYDASTTGLDKFMNNPTFNPKLVNLNEIRQRSAAEFGQLAKQLRSFKEDRNMYRKGFDSTVLAKYGYSQEEASRIAESIRRGQVSPEDAAAEAIYNSIYNSTNVESWTNNRDLGIQAVRNAIAEGVIGAVGQITPQVVTDQMAATRYKYQQELQSYKDKLAAQNEFNLTQNAASILESWDPNTAYLNRALGINTDTKIISSQNIDEYKRNGWTDEYGNITSKGIAALRTPDRQLVKENKHSSKTPENTEFRLPTDAEWAEYSEYENLQKFKQDYGNFNTPNMSRMAVMRQHIAGDDRAVLEDLIKGAIGDGELYSVGRYDETNKRITNGPSISKDEFKEKIKNGDRVLFIGNMPYTNQILFQMDDGEWYHMPTDIYSSNALKIINDNNILLQQENLTPVQEALYGNNVMTMLGQPLNRDTGNDIKRPNTTVQISME